MQEKEERRTGKEKDGGGGQDEGGLEGRRRIRRNMEKVGE